MVRYWLGCGKVWVQMRVGKGLITVRLCWMRLISVNMQGPTENRQLQFTKCSVIEMDMTYKRYGWGSFEMDCVKKRYGWG